MTRLALEQDGEERSRKNGGPTRIIRKKLHRESAEAGGGSGGDKERRSLPGGRDRLMGAATMPPHLHPPRGLCSTTTPTSVRGGVAAVLWI
jgi:hypothetical protein